MGKSSNIAPMLMLFFIVFSLLFMSFQARILHDEQQANAMQSNIDSQLLPRELGFDLTKLKHYERLSSTIHRESDRVSPGGPDPQHH